MILTTEQKQTYIAGFCEINDKEIIDDLNNKIDREWSIKVNKDYHKGDNDDLQYYLYIDNELIDTMSIYLYKILKNVLLIPQFKVGEKVKGIVRKYGRRIIYGKITEISLNEHSLLGAWVSVREDSEEYHHWLMPIEDITHIGV